MVLPGIDALVETMLRPRPCGRRNPPLGLNGTRLSAFRPVPAISPWRSMRRS